MKKLKGFLFNSACLALLLVLQACPRCNNPEVPIDYNYLKVELLDNTGQWPQLSLTDTLYAGAIAFRATLADTTQMYFAHSPGILSLVQEARAESCIQKFVPRQQIETLAIFTLLPLNEAHPAGSDVSSLFYGWHGGASYSENLYLTLAQILQTINATPYLNDWPEQKTDLFLSTEVQYPLAQFEIRFRLSDNTTLSAYSPLIKIRQP